LLGSSGGRRKGQSGGEEGGGALPSGPMNIVVNGGVDETLLYKAASDSLGPKLTLQGRKWDMLASGGRQTVLYVGKRFGDETERNKNAIPS